MKDLTRYATSATSPTMEAFADYLIAEVYGGTLPADFDAESFRKGVALGGSTRGYFQASDEWKSDERNYLANVDSRRLAKAEERANAAKAAKAKAEARELAAIAKFEEAVAAAKAKLSALAPDESAPESDESAPESDETIVSSDELEEDSKPVESAPESDETIVSSDELEEDSKPVESAPEESAPEEVPSPASVPRRSRRAA